MIRITKEREHFVIADYDDDEDKVVSSVVLSEKELQDLWYAIEKIL